MSSKDIRRSFLDYFAQRDHRVVPSAPLVPLEDPTLLFVNAGMVQFKGYFQGAETPEFRRAAGSQKCLRVSGKHNDLENVGPSPRHHTFFEMLGNFSFGDYFKEEAIRFAWELVTEVWGLSKEHLFATVFQEDDDAFELWGKLSSLEEGRILRCGHKDNFWAMGETGPCGPCSEVHIDLFPDQPAVDWEEGTESGRYLEIWNLVFMQFDRDEEGSLNPLPKPSVDTGAGLERVAAVLQGVHSNYDTDLFQPILKAAAELAGTRYGGTDGEADVSLRVLADHLRAVSFLLADGVIPGNEGRGYVLRRILRRAVRHGMRLGFEEPFLHRLVPVLGEVLGDTYPELRATREATESTIQVEEEKFLSTVAGGARQLQEEIETARRAGRTELSGEKVFQLYDTHGLPVEVIREIAEEERFTVDETGFERELEAQRKRSRAATGDGQKQQLALQAALQGDGEGEETKFLGYHRHALDKATVLRLAAFKDSRAVAATALGAGESGAVVLDRSVFYAEGGGQVGDVGEITWEGGRARVTDTRKNAAGTFFHHVNVEAGNLQRGALVALAIDTERRREIQRNHTATHLLHAALRQVLGTGVRQAGSLVAPDRLRFDFTYPQPVTAEELGRIEDQINAWVRRAEVIGVEVRGYQEAVNAGAMALFGEKYGDQVRTVEVPGYSLELCGGCHVANTGEIALFQVIAEKGIASGVRRIEAVSGEGALVRVRERETLLQGAAVALNTTPERAADEAAALRRKLKEQESELTKLRMQLVSGAAADGDDGPVEVEGVKLLVRQVPPAPVNELRNMADTLRSKLGSGVVVLGTGEPGKVSLLVAVSRDLAGKKVKAGDLVKALAEQVGGRGGGRPDFAQAGGKDFDKLPAALEQAPELLRDLVP